MLLHNRDSEDIRGSENPTSTRRSLIGDRGTFKGDLDIEQLLIRSKRASLVDDIVELAVAESSEG
jgi:hypothetical protein